MGTQKPYTGYSLSPLPPPPPDFTFLTCKWCTPFGAVVEQTVGVETHTNSSTTTLPPLPVIFRISYKLEPHPPLFTLSTTSRTRCAKMQHDGLLHKARFVTSK